MSRPVRAARWVVLVSAATALAQPPSRNAALPKELLEAHRFQREFVTASADAFFGHLRDELKVPCELDRGALEKALGRATGDAQVRLHPYALPLGVHMEHVA